MERSAVIRQEFTLDEVSEGLAYMSVRERAMTRASGPMGAKTETKTAGKGEAIFDQRQGMWLELTTKSRTRMQMGAMPGMPESGQHQSLHINRVTMEKQ